MPIMANPLKSATPREASPNHGPRRGSGSAVPSKVFPQSFAFPGCRPPDVWGRRWRLIKGDRDPGASDWLAGGSRPRRGHFAWDGNRIPYFLDLGCALIIRNHVIGTRTGIKHCERRYVSPRGHRGDPVFYFGNPPNSSSF